MTSPAFRIAPDVPALEWQGFIPFQLLSLEEMLETFSLADLIERMVSYRKWGEFWEKQGAGAIELTDTNADRTERFINGMTQTCSKLEFDVADCVKRIRGKLSGSDTYSEPMSFYWMEWNNRIINEANKHMFAYIPQNKVPYFRADALFGYDVEEAFPSATIDIMTAGDCYAVGAYTACVFHLMRCVESGARSLVYGLKAQSHLSRPVQLCDWGDLNAAIQEGVKKLRVGSRKTIQRKEKYEFYNHAAAQFMYFKDAWRNNVAHARKVYIEGETMDILNNTRQFMKHLATRVHDRTR